MQQEKQQKKGRRIHKKHGKISNIVVESGNKDKNTAPAGSPGAAENMNENAVSNPPPGRPFFVHYIQSKEELSWTKYR